MKIVIALENVGNAIKKGEEYIVLDIVDEVIKLEQGWYAMRHFVLKETNILNGGSDVSKTTNG